MYEQTPVVVEEKTHAKLGASSAYRWAACPGSVVLEEQLADAPRSSSPAARWGTAAHELAANLLAPFGDEALTVARIKELLDVNAAEAIGTTYEVEGEVIAVDDDMAACVQHYIEQVAVYLTPGCVLLVEQALPLDHVTGEEGAEGTGDAVIVDPAQHILYTLDLKSGKGVIVDAVGNKQLALYASGTRAALDLIYGPFDDTWAYHMEIVQPRIGGDGGSFAVLTDQELTDMERELAFAAKRVGEAREAYKLAGATPDWSAEYLSPDEDACRFCPARASCPALRGIAEAALALAAPPAKADDFPDLSLPKKAAAAEKPTAATTTEQLAEVLKAEPLITLWLAAVREEAFNRAMQGEQVPGFKLVQGRQGNRAWGDDGEAERLLKAARLKADEMYSRKVISPTVAEKLLKDRPRTWLKLDALIVRAEGKPSLARADSKAPDYIPPKAEAGDFPDLEVDPFS